MKRIFLIVGVALLSACSDEDPTHAPTPVFSIREIGELSTTEYTISKVIELKDNKEWYKFGDRNILISCRAKIKAGVNFSQLKNEDIVISGKEVKIRLPYPQIQSFDMDPASIRTEMEDINGFRSSFSQSEKNEILRQGEKSIRANMGQTSILEQARQNAESFIRSFYAQLGYTVSEINFIKPYETEIKAR